MGDSKDSNDFVNYVLSLTVIWTLILLSASLLRCGHPLAEVYLGKRV
jgi:hypothetical protein